MSDDCIANGWRLYAHPLLLSQIEALEVKVKQQKRKDPKSYFKKPAAKRLAAIRHLIFEAIPTDPGNDRYRQGSTLGVDHKHWRRAKFFQQCRLFFRYHQSQKIIVFAWVNDDKTLRAYESRSDAYAVFRKMLESGSPPTDWDSLVESAKSMFDQGLQQ